MTGSFQKSRIGNVHMMRPYSLMSCGRPWTSHVCSVLQSSFTFHNVTLRHLFPGVRFSQFHILWRIRA